MLLDWPPKAADVTHVRERASRATHGRCSFAVMRRVSGLLRRPASRAASSEFFVSSVARTLVDFVPHAFVVKGLFTHG
jgi:hypothetical protein